MIDDASRFVGSIPDNYDRFLGPRLFEEYAADLTSRLVRHRPSRLLELAAGTGIVTRKLRTSLPGDCEIVATDLNEPMLEIAKRRFSAGERVVFKQADAMDLPFADESFDAVACQFGVMFFPDKGRGYTEVLRVLEPGGVYGLNAWDSREANPFAKIAHGAVEELFPDDPPGFYKVPFHYHDIDEIRKDILDAGFSRVTVERVSILSEIPSADDFATGLVFGNPLNEEITSRGGDPQAVREAIARAIEDRLGIEMPLSALVAEATKA